MLAAQRRDYLIEVLRRDGKIVAKSVAADLGLSEDSVRRDLRELAAEGRCQRVYGERCLPRQRWLTMRGEAGLPSGQAEGRGRRGEPDPSREHGDH